VQVEFETLFFIIFVKKKKKTSGELVGPMGKLAERFKAKM